MPYIIVLSCYYTLNCKYITHLEFQLQCSYTYTVSYHDCVHIPTSLVSHLFPTGIIGEYFRLTRNYSSQCHQTGQDVSMDHQEPRLRRHVQLRFCLAAHVDNTVWRERLDVWRCTVCCQCSLQVHFLERQHTSHQRSFYQQTL